MSSIDLPKALGQYMLKGWVLTAETCPKDNCSVPLMRSPKSHSPVTTFCAKCDEHPNGSETFTSASRPRAESSDHSPSSYASSSQVSRASTPPTDVSSGLSSPTFALPVETAESVRRRQQSDAASEEIGKRLLKGWAMLADECPNTSCFGVPLVRAPLAGGKEPKKECVACGNKYIDEKDAAGWAHLVALPRESRSAAGPSSSAATIRNLRVSRDEEKTVVMNALELHETSLAPVEKGKGKDIAIPADLAAVAETSEALSVALRALSERLSWLTSKATVVDPASISTTADAISKVLDALSRIKAFNNSCECKM